MSVATNTTADATGENELMRFNALVEDMEVLQPLCFKSAVKMVVACTCNTLDVV